jgi:hypothetical protein
MKHIEVIQEALYALEKMLYDAEAYQGLGELIAETLRGYLSEAKKELVQQPCGRLESDPDEGHIFVPRIEGDWSMLGEDLYTKAPVAQQQWVGLTEEDNVVSIARDAFACRFSRLPVPESRIKAFAEEIEAKLKEKNS